MIKLFLALPLLFALSCKQKTPAYETQAQNKQGYKDEHTFSKPEEAIVQHLDLDIKVDFSAQQITGKASWTIKNLTNTDKIIFDTRELLVTKVTLDNEEKEAEFSLGNDTLKYMGQPLTVKIQPNTKKINIHYQTSKEAAALQWLSPLQTAGKRRPFLFTQSEPILARTWIPCQDGPAIRFTYNASVLVPQDLLALMSAENPQSMNADGNYRFKQVHPIPSYLLALAVGDLRFKPIDKRTGIYAEPAVLDKAVWEFADMGKMVDAAEKLYGAYRWGRYDVLVLPPAFPYGGMENPNLTFATPTVIAGDRSLVSLIAHELAHSWSGNQVTNATWNDMWLNEGFTTYFERRIIESVYGKDEAQMQEVLGRQALEKTVRDIGKSNQDTRLKGVIDGRDPDAVFSDIPYEKGYAFLRTIEEAVGRDRFDEFLRSYFDSHVFQSLTTEQFLSELESKLVGKDNAVAGKIRENEWIYEPGIPSNIPPSSSAEFKSIDSIIANWSKTGISNGLSKQVRSNNELLYFISQLPADLNPKQMASLDREFNFTRSGNAEIQCSWFTLAIRHEYKPAYMNMEKFLINVGRRKYLVPLYKELIETPGGKELAREIYNKARPNYHPVSYHSIDALLK